MRIARISEHVYRLGIWFVIPINVWVVVGEAGLTLVDTGVSPMAKDILRFVGRLGRLARILLTHGHLDHVGGVPKILGAQSVPVFVHPTEIPYMEGRLAYPRRARPQTMLAPGIASPLAVSPQGPLPPIADLVPYHTPGHSPGHVVYYHRSDDLLLAGDLFTSRSGRLRVPMPMFTGDMDEAVRSAEVLREIKPGRLEICHGGPVENPLAQLDAYVAGYRASRRARKAPSSEARTAPTGD